MSLFHCIYSTRFPHFTKTIFGPFQIKSFIVSNTREFCICHSSWTSLFIWTPCFSFLIFQVHLRRPVAITSQPFIVQGITRSYSTSFGSSSVYLIGASSLRVQWLFHDVPHTPKNGCQGENMQSGIVACHPLRGMSFFMGMEVLFLLPSPHQQ